MHHERVFVVRSGPDLRRLRIYPPERAPEERASLPAWIRWRHGAAGGIDLLLGAVRHIVYDMKRHRIQFGLVEGGTEVSAVRQLSDRLGVVDNVIFLGRRTTES